MRLRIGTRNRRTVGSKHKQRTLGCVGSLFCAGALVATLPSSALGAVPRPTTQATSGSLGSRLRTITIPAPKGEISSKWLSYSGPPRANVLLPPHYNPHRRYPLLVLLHGLTCNYDWYVQSGLINAVAGLNAVVVMPEGGNGWYTDWWNDGQRGGPSWESYELDQVLPTVLARYPILPQRRYHAIAGISMGGLGAVYLGGRLPGFFGSVATLSGFVDPGWFAPIAEFGMGLTADASENGDNDVDPVDGPPSGFYFQGHNPAELTTNLKQTRVFESTSTGIPSLADLLAILDGQGLSVIGGAITEGVVIYPMNILYHQALTAAGVNVTYQAHPGGHDLPDFYSELQAMLAWNPFDAVTSDPASWTNDTVATSGQLWDVDYHFATPPDQVVQFHQTGKTLSVSAAGSAVTLTTAAGCRIHTATPATVSLASRSCARSR